MEYEVAISKAWSSLGALTKEKNFSIRLLADTYSVDTDKKSVFSSSCNVPAKTYTGLILLHYLAKTLIGLPGLTGEWISFKDLPGGQGYYPVFKKRVIGTIIRKYGKEPKALLKLKDRFIIEKADMADASVKVDVLDNVPILITLWEGDDEFGPDANVLFDKNINEIFCTEDIVVLSEILVHSI